LRAFRRDAQIIFQDPYASLNPRMTVGQILAEPLALHDLVPNRQRRERVEELLRLVGLEPRSARRYAHEFSGGQRQRIAIARVVLKDAPILVLDEATSALDSEVELAIQDQLLGLMQGKTVIAIAHRLSTIARMDRLVVLEQGRIVEQGTHDALLRLDGHYAQLWRHQSGGFLPPDDPLADPDAALGRRLSAHPRSLPCCA